MQTHLSRISYWPACQGCTFFRIRVNTSSFCSTSKWPVSLERALPSRSQCTVGKGSSYGTGDEDALAQAGCH